MTQLTLICEAPAEWPIKRLIGHSAGASQISVNWVILSYIICVIGELCLSPTGNSAAVKLAPKAFNAQMMSLWKRLQNDQLNQS